MKIPINSRNKPKLYCIHHSQCDPKKCTAIKLKRLHLISFIKSLSNRINNAIVLNPFSQIVISPKDKNQILNFGLVVIDCSWNEILSVGIPHYDFERKLPSLVAANSTNYGKWAKLSSAEAIAAALYITGFDNLADEILSKFRWGIEFKKINGF